MICTPDAILPGVEEKTQYFILNKQQTPFKKKGGGVMLIEMIENMVFGCLIIFK